ncbi:DNA-damage-repair/toleration protein DRT102 [Pyrus ussuriensis x Pyrus communis]|uniref:DNA-damage-repair/toleration protein DRT102 n=1 Tax=Pyrus ussuriensis x Pyrus communis TaxID=2448454 RepID=A0A5N5HAU8_9ROSA|nr:DNA-damage-repair/toleration protein DRT102 [Pyrus ussuriensis x Pyrus communis]
MPASALQYGLGFGGISDLDEANPQNHQIQPPIFSNPTQPLNSIHVGVVDGMGVLGVCGGEISGSEFVEELVEHDDFYANAASDEAVGLEGTKRR